jgi:hypothetical protein
VESALQPPHFPVCLRPQAGQEFLLPLCCDDTLGVLGIAREELAELCAACTHFIRFVLDQVRRRGGGLRWCRE